MSYVTGQEARSPWLRRALGGVVLAASVAFLVVVASEHGAELSSLPWRELSPAQLALALVLYASTIMLLGIGWHLWLRALGQPSTARTAVTVTAISQVAKYLPGNVGHWVGRVAMSVSRGVSPVAAIYALGLETLWAIVACGGFVALSWSVIALPQAGLPDQGSRLLLMGAVVAMLAAAYVLPAAVGRLPSAWRARLGLDALLKPPGVVTSLACLAIYLVSWLANGAALELVMGSGIAVSTPGLVWAGAAYATAWLSGYLLPGAPGGLGVREAILVLLLEPALGAGPALGVALVMRLVTSIGDLLTFGIGWALRKP